MASKVICINLWPGDRIYVRTSEQKWGELTQNANVVDNIVRGRELDQRKVERIIRGEYPEREDYQVVCRTPWRFTYEQFGWDFTPPRSDYWVNYSTNDMPIQIHGDFH